jgi:hypothetical protein
VRALLFAVALSACSSDVTQLVVLVDSDMAESELTAVRANVLSEANDNLWEHYFEEPSLPFSFGVLPKDGDPSQRIVIEIAAVGPGEVHLFSRRARTRLIEGKTLLLEMYLASSCRATTCGEGTTCTQRGCQPELIDEAMLAELEKPGDELRRDRGVRLVDSGFRTTGDLSAGTPTFRLYDHGFESVQPVCTTSFCLSGGIAP